MQVDTKHVCRQCGSEVKAPSFLGLSWCAKCETYERPELTEVEPVGDEAIAGSDHAYNYTTWRPRGNSFQRGETPEHRFMFVKRQDRSVKGSKGISYKAKCTCKKWNNPNGFTNRQAAYRQWQGHMAEVDKQGTLPVN